MSLNRNGGVVTETRSDLLRAKKADLITLPKRIEGTNCGNCVFFSEGDIIKKTVQSDIQLGQCNHPAIAQAVSDRMCCAAWDQTGAIRAWE